MVRLFYSVILLLQEDVPDSFEECYLNTLIYFQKMTRWRFGALNGQNRLSAALSFMVGCNNNLQDWALVPGQIDPEKVLDIYVEHHSNEDFSMEYIINGQVVQAVPSSNDFIAYIKRSWRNPKKTLGMKFFPTIEVRVIADRVLDLENPSILHLLQSLVDIS